jgi:hypothetical protein
MLQYFAYGLGIHSNLALPEFIPQASISHDVTVTLKSPSTDYVDLAQPRQYIQVSPQETIVVIQNIAHFHVSQGREIIVTPFPQSEERLIQLCIAGSIIAILLYQRGFQIILHASAIALKDQVACFLGNSGDGKSTTAAALVAHGHQIVSDDVVPVLVDSSVQVVPAYPQIKIGPEIAEALNYPADSLSFLHPNLGEYAYRSDTNFSTHPMPFSRIYILNDSDELSIQVLPPQEAIVEIIRHTYGLKPFGAAINASQHFRSCIELLNQVVVCRLNRPRSIPLLPEVVRLIERDVLPPVQSLASLS